MAACTHASESWSNGEFVCKSCGRGSVSGAPKLTAEQRLERAERELASWSPEMIGAHAESYADQLEYVELLRSA